MNEEGFETFLDQCLAELDDKQRALAKHGLGAFARWFYDQTVDRLQFFDAADDLRLQCTVINIGSFAEKSNSWLWAWANASVLPWLRQRSAPLKELAVEADADLFAEEHAFAVEDDATLQGLVAMSVHHLGARGYYRGGQGAGKPQVVFAVMGVEAVEKQ